MLPKKRRLTRKEIPLLLRGKRSGSEHIIMYVLENSENVLKHSGKFSISVSKKVAKKAVDRNKIRRRGYVIIMDNLKKINPKNDYLFTLKSGTMTLSYQNLREEILKLLSPFFVIS